MPRCDIHNKLIITPPQQIVQGGGVPRFFYFQLSGCAVTTGAAGLLLCILTNH